MNIGLEILTIFLLIIVNGVFALSEIAVVSSRKARLQQRINEGDKGARTALDLAENPNLFLSTVQIGITLIGVLAGAVGGATIAEALALQFEKIPVLLPYAESLGLGIVVVLITTFTLILGELVPKRLALHNPERIASVIAGPMLLISKIFSPLVRLMSGSTDLILRLIGIKPNEEPPVTEEEIQVLIDQGTQAGVFEESEQDMVEGVFRLNNRRVGSLMTPRSEIAWLDVNDSPEEIRIQIEENLYSRFPVCEDSLDNVKGVIEARDLLLESLHGEPLLLKRNLQAPVYIPETALASRALELFKNGVAEMMLVVDEFGSTQGLLTIFDILEEIVGDIDQEPQATQRQDGSWLLDGMLPVEDFKEIFNLRHLPDEDEYETLGGFIMLHLGRVPLPADRFDWSGLLFEVMDMDGKRVDKVLVTLKPAKLPDSTTPPE
ncbi:MAG: HlyC/CorC family transporter [Chloroflexi bacterium]|nr:MAG: HlyC/CorC family transporter [Chloroflexota bacterium]